MEHGVSGRAEPPPSKASRKKPAEVIVSDMRMPGMDGWQLLAEVKKLYPQTVRLVLSGHADPGAIMRSVGTAHQYMAKPCDSATLKAAIAQSQALRSLLNSDALALLVGDVGMLPSYPKAYQEISSCLQQPNASLTDAARIISRDVAMTANIMKLVNSAFFGARQSITSIERAVAYLGLDTLGALVLGHSVFQTRGASAAETANFEGLWRHSLRTATIARAIALFEKLPRARAEEAFLAGMLHDVGRVVFASRSAAVASGALDIQIRNGWRTMRKWAPIYWACGDFQVRSSRPSPSITRQVDEATPASARRFWCTSAIDSRAIAARASVAASGPGY